MEWTPLIRIRADSNTAGSRGWEELPRDTSGGVARDFPLAVEPLNGYSTRGSSRPLILLATQVDLLLGSKFGLIKGW